MHKALSVAFLSVSVFATAQTGPPASPPAAGSRTGTPAPNSLGNASSGFVLNPMPDQDPPQLPSDLKPGGILIFSKTVAYRDEPAIQASDAALAAIAHDRGWPYLVTENGAVMNPEQLAKFKLVIFSNTSGDLLTDTQKTAFQSWMEAGGSFIGIHGAGGDPIGNMGHSSLADWKWYIDTLIGAQFFAHPRVMPADIRIDDSRSVLTKGLPALWHRSDEWYAFTASPRNKPGFRILASADEKSYTPGRATMGADHPLVWWHCVGRGHAFYSALGHGGTMYSEPLMLQLLGNAMSWSLVENGRNCAVGK